MFFMDMMDVDVHKNDILPAFISKLRCDEVFLYHLATSFEISQLSIVSNCV